MMPQAEVRQPETLHYSEAGPLEMLKHTAPVLLISLIYFQQKANYLKKKTVLAEAYVV
jgi:hypothetical protein